MPLIRVSFLIAISKSEITGNQTPVRRFCPGQDVSAIVRDLQVRGWVVEWPNIVDEMEKGGLGRRKWIPGRPLCTNPINNSHDRFVFT